MAKKSKKVGAKKGMSAPKPAAKKSAKKTGQMGPAKKAAAKPVMKTAMKGASTAAAKPSMKKAPAKGTPKRKGVTGGPTPRGLGPAPEANPSVVNTGSGMSAGEVGRDVVAKFNKGQLKEIEDAYWSSGVVSVEGEHVGMAWHGRAAVEEKNKGWMATHKLHGASADGPYVGASGFAIKFSMDVEDTNDGSRTMMEEVGVYQVQNGKIVREEFMYGRSTPITPATPATQGS